MKKDIIKIIIASILFIIALCIPFEQNYINIFLYIISYAIVGLEIVIKAVKNIFKGEVFDENFLMAVATIGAFAIKEYPEAVAVMLFYQVGEMFQDYALDKSRKSITSLIDIRPDYANVKRNGKTEKVNPSEVKIGEIIVVKPGEKVPLDGIVIEGTSMVDTSGITGEPVPKSAKINDEVLSGFINKNGVLNIKVTKEFENSTVSKMLELVENASSRKAKSENFITKFAKVYTPIVVVLAVILAIVPPFILKIGTFSEWLYKALSFLVVSCPCALVISIPLGFFGGIGGLAKKGVLVKGSNYLEGLSNTEMVVFDKTGTLTKGVFEVQEVKVAEDYEKENLKLEANKKCDETINKQNLIKHDATISKQNLIKIVAHAENFSNHPIALALKKEYGKEINEKLVTNVKELAGMGIEAYVKDFASFKDETDAKKQENLIIETNVKENHILIGNKKLMDERKINYVECKEAGTCIYVAINNKFAGTILIADKIKEDAKETIKNLKSQNLKTVILTGDRKNVAEDVAKKLEIDEVFSELLPNEKVEKIEQLMKNKKCKNGNLVFVGDGINDSPAIALSDIGIAMGALGSDAAIEAADVVIMTDEPSKICTAIKASKKTMKIVKENIIFAIFVKVLILILTAFGISNMWQAVFADVGVSVIAILNALRAL